MNQWSIHEAVFELLQDEAENIEVGVSVSKDLHLFMQNNMERKSSFKCSCFLLFQVNTFHCAVFLRTGKSQFNLNIKHTDAS